MQPDIDAIRGEVECLADELVAAGDLAGFVAVFGTDDIQFNIRSLSDEAIREIFEEYCTDD